MAIGFKAGLVAVVSMATLAFSLGACGDDDDGTSGTAGTAGTTAGAAGTTAGTGGTGGTGATAGTSGAAGTGATAGTAGTGGSGTCTAVECTTAGGPDPACTEEGSACGMPDGASHPVCGFPADMETDCMDGEYAAPEGAAFLCLPADCTPAAE